MSLSYHFGLCQSGERLICFCPPGFSPTAIVLAWQEGWILSPFSVHRRWNDIWAPCQMWAHSALFPREWSLLFQLPLQWGVQMASPPFAVLRVDKTGAQHLPSLRKSDYTCCNSKSCGRKHCSLLRGDTKYTSPILLWLYSPFLFFPQSNMNVYCSVSRCHLEMWWEIEWTVQSTAKLTYFNFRIKCNPQLQGEAVAWTHWLDSLSKWVAHCLNRWQMLFETSCIL